MASRRVSLVVLAIHIALIGSLFAQDAATIVYAEGDAFTVVRDSGREERHTWRDPDFIGLGLAGGDSVLTDEGTYLEIRINANGSVVRVAENTSFIVTGDSDETNTRLAVTYGRVRAAVQTLRGAEAFSIRGRTVVAGVRGTEFGVSVIASRSGKIEDTIFVLEGEVAVRSVVTADDQESLEDKNGTDPALVALSQEVLVSAGKLVTASSTRDPLVVETIDPLFRAAIEQDRVRTPVLLRPPIDPSIDAPGRQTAPTEDPEVDDQSIVVDRGPRSVVFRMQSGGGFFGAAGADFYLGTSRRIRTGLVAGATVLDDEPTPAVAVSAAFTPTFGALATSFGVSSYLTADTEEATAAVGASIGLGIRFGRVLHELFLDNTVYFNAYPDAELPLVYMPAIGVRL